MCVAVCTGLYLIDALRYSPQGQVVFAIIDGSGKEQLPDGNWSPEDVRDAAGDNDNIAKTLAKILDDADSTLTDAEFAGLTNLTRSVAQRLTGEHDRWEQIDHESSWWDRNGATVLAIAQVGLSELAFGPCSAFCAAGAAAISTFSAYNTCTGDASGLQCATSIGAAAVSIASAGAASGASLADAGSKVTASLAGSLLSRATAEPPAWTGRPTEPTDTGFHCVAPPSATAPIWTVAVADDGVLTATLESDTSATE